MGAQGEQGCSSVCCRVQAWARGQGGLHERTWLHRVAVAWQLSEARMPPHLQAGSRQCLVANSMPFAQFVNTAGTSPLLPVCMSDEVRCPGMQATIQGALGSVPLLLIQSRLSGKADYAQYETWGSEILHATAFSILITAPVGLLVIGLLGKTCLKQVIIYTVSCCLPNQPQTQAQIRCQVCCGCMTLLMLPWIMLGPVSVQHLVGLGAPLTCSACFRRASLPLQQFYLQSMLCGLPLTTMTAVPLSQMWRVRLLQGVERSSRMHHHPPPCQIRETPAM